MWYPVRRRSNRPSALDLTFAPTMWSMTARSAVLELVGAAPA